ncbi:MAG: restriction endonuclease subunit S [Candidatus Aminicenantes bacterium]|jgi:type I restriction enzyme S subunit
MNEMKIKTIRLGQVVTILKGKKVANIYSNYKQNRKRFIQIEDLRSDANLKYTDEDNAIEVERKDVVIAWDGANAGTIGYGLNGIIGSTLAALKIQDDRILSGFLGKFLQSRSKYIRDKCTGVTIPHVNRRVLENIKIPLFSIQDQKRIESILVLVDDLCRKRKFSFEILEELLRSIFLDMFSKNAVDYKHWKYEKIENLVKPGKNTMRTGPFGSDLLHSEFVDEGIFVVGIDNAVNNRFSWAKKRFITKEKYEKLKRYTLYPGDVLVTIMGTLGKSAVVPDDIPLSINSKHLAALTLNKQKVNPYFISYSIHSDPYILHQIRKNTRGAIMGGLNLRIIKKLKLKLPPIKLQNHFEKIFKHIDYIREKMQKSLEEMDNLFHSLMQQAFKGKLNLNEDAVDSLAEKKIPTEDLHKTPVVEEISAASPEEFITLHHTVQCDIKDYSKKIEVEHKILMQLVNIDKYKAKQKDKSLKEWIKEKLNEITQIALFGKRYVDILLDFEKSEEDRETMKIIKDGMRQFAESIGYTTKHIIVEPNLKPFLLKRDGFIVQKTGTFSTLNNRVNVKLNIIVTGKFCDLSKISQYITPEKDIIVEMEHIIYNEAERQIHSVDPEKFYLPFKFPDEESIEEMLKIRIKERLESIFFAEDVNVIIKRLETELIQRILNLINGNPYHMDIEVMPLRGGGAKEKVNFEVEFLVETVSRWNTFIYKNFESHTQEIEKVKDVLNKDISEKFQTVPYEILKYISTKDSRTLLEIARKSQSKITIIFGLDIKISYVKRKPIKAEEAQQKILEEKVRAQIELETGIIEKEKKVILDKVDKLQNIEIKYLDPEYSDEEPMAYAEKELEKIKKKLIETTIHKSEIFSLPAPESSEELSYGDVHELSSVSEDNAEASFKGLSTKYKPKFADFLRHIKYISNNQPFQFSDIMQGVKGESIDYEKMKYLVFYALRKGLNEKGLHLKQCFFDDSFDSGDEELNKKLRGTIGFQIEYKK